MKRDIIAKDILNFCKEKKKIFITTRYTKGDIICSKNNEPYTSHQLGNGFRVLKQKGIAKKVSDNRWQIASYEFRKREEKT